MGKSRHLIRLAHPGWTPALGSSRSRLSGRRSRGGPQGQWSGGSRGSGGQAPPASRLGARSPGPRGRGGRGSRLCLGLAGEVRRRCVQDARHLLMRSGAPGYVSSVNSQRGTEGWAESRAGDQGARGNGSPQKGPGGGARGMWCVGVEFGWEEGRVFSRKEKNSKNLPG